MRAYYFDEEAADTDNYVIGSSEKTVAFPGAGKTGKWEGPFETVGAAEQKIRLTLTPCLTSLLRSSCAVREPSQVRVNARELPTREPWAPHLVNHVRSELRTYQLTAPAPCRRHPDARQPSGRAPAIPPTRDCLRWRPGYRPSVLISPTPGTSVAHLLGGAVTLPR